MADDEGTPRHTGASPARHVKRSSEGGRQVNMEAGEGRSRNAMQDTMRVEPGDESYPGASSDESTRAHIDMMAENIARMHPSHEQRKQSIAAKIRAAIEAMC